jgi:hypothetical protein
MKKNLKETFLVFVLCWMVASANAGDWSQWRHETPGNNEISNQSYHDRHRNMFICRDYNVLIFQYIEEWYFYKGHVIGTMEPNQSNRFFVINEQSCSLDTFDRAEEFDQYLTNHGLKPLFWTRWYDFNWGTFVSGTGNGSFFLFIFFGGIFWLILGLLFVIIFLIMYVPKRRHRWVLVSIFLLFIFIRILLDVFPGSI